MKRSISALIAILLAACGEPVSTTRSDNAVPGTVERARAQSSPFVGRWVSHPPFDRSREPGPDNIMNRVVVIISQEGDQFLVRRPLEEMGRVYNTREYIASLTEDGRLVSGEYMEFTYLASTDSLFHNGHRLSREAPAQ